MAGLLLSQPRGICGLSGTFCDVVFEIMLVLFDHGVFVEDVMPTKRQIADLVVPFSVMVSRVLPDSSGASS